MTSTMRDEPAAFPVGSVVVTIVHGRRYSVIKLEMQGLTSHRMGASAATAEEVAKTFHEFADAITARAKAMKTP